jgi:prenylcysteine oxidase/farnesylcysteine lyase
VSRANYGQDASLQAFANLVSLAGAGFAGKLFSIRDGNEQLCRGLLRTAAARVRTDTGVRAIVRWPAADGAPPRYAIATAGGGAETFDAVIVATPLEAADIAFEGVEPPEAAHPRRAYQVTHATFVAGRLNPAYFGARCAADLPGAILTIEDPAIPFSSIGALGRAADAGLTVYKIFSREPAGERLLSALFAERAQTERLAWRAYPVLAPLPLWPPFRLGHGLYYVNAMESAVSTMETEALASRNVVNLLLQDCGAAES